LEQENDDFYQIVAQIVKRCLQDSGVDPGKVAAIAFNSQMAGIGTVDEDYNPATRFDSWLDMRCQPNIEYVDTNHGDLVTRLTGCPPTCDYGPKILWWKEKQPEDYKRITKFVMPAGYVAGKMVGLKGEDAFMDYTFIHLSGFSDAQNGRRSDELFELMGVDKEKLPRIVEPWHVAGEVTDKVAVEFGLAPGTIVAEPKISESLTQKLTGFYQDMVERGLEQITEVLRHEILPENKKIADYLEIESGTLVYEITRLRYVNGEPILFVTTYLPFELCPQLEDTDISDRSLYAFLEEECSIFIAYGRRFIEAVLANETEARLLEINIGVPLILLNSVSYLEDGTPIEYYHALHRGDRSRS
jgi:DNA-binding GntR family transcriptional regulator